MKSVHFLTLHCIYFFIFYYLFCHDSDMTHDINMNNINLNKILQLFFNKIAMLTKTVQQLQVQIVSMQSSTQILMNTHDESEDNLELQNDSEVTEFFMKSEKWFNFLTFLEQTYDDASRKHIAMMKLENLQQRNQEFTSFFFKFLDLIDELDWNELVKVAML